MDMECTHCPVCDPEGDGKEVLCEDHVEGIFALMQFIKDDYEQDDSR